MASCRMSSTPAPTVSIRHRGFRTHVSLLKRSVTFTGQVLVVHRRETVSVEVSANLVSYTIKYPGHQGEKTVF